MDKTFYVSGFLYNLKTGQILLIQSETKDDLSALWSMLGGESKVGEDAKETFRRIIFELLNVDLKTKNIHPVYDYFHDAVKMINYVFYAEVRKNIMFESPKEGTLSWVTFNETVKMPFPEHIKQDVIVGKRVIDAKERDAYAQEQADILGALA